MIRCYAGISSEVRKWQAPDFPGISCYEFFRKGGDALLLVDCNCSWDIDSRPVLEVGTVIGCKYFAGQPQDVFHSYGVVHFSFSIDEACVANGFEKSQVYSFI